MLRIRRSFVIEILLFALLLAVPALLALPAEASNPLSAADPIPLPDAAARIKSARSLLKKKSSNKDDLEAAVDDLALVHASVGPAGREQAGIRVRAEHQLLKALMLFKATRKDPDKNLRTSINVRAAKKLAGLGAVLGTKQTRALSLKIRKLIQVDLLQDRDHEKWNQDHLEATFAALSALNDPTSVTWMTGKFMHTKSRDVPFLIAAHKALPQFTNVSGKIRHELVKRLLIAYSGVELVAATSSNVPADAAKKRFWDQIRVYTIPVIQAYAKKPENAKGEVLSSLREYTAWFKAHRAVNKAPWVAEVKKAK